jgi:gamma-glutamyl phosphate reductase
MENVKTTPMRAMGKLWDMDVFTWVNPDTNALLNTLKSFPFKVLWLGSAKEVSAVVSIDESVLNVVETIVTYNATNYGFEEDWLSAIVKGAGTGNLVDALYFVDQYKSPKTVVLFTTSGDEATFALEQFENYVQLMRS